MLECHENSVKIQTKYIFFDFNMKYDLDVFLSQIHFSQNKNESV